MKTLFTFLFFSTMSLFADPMNISPSEIGIDDLSAAQQFSPPNKNWNKNTFKINNIPKIPLYGYFHTKSSEILMNNEPVRLDKATKDIPEIHINPLDLNTIFIDYPGRYYVSWQISTTKDFDLDKGLRFALFSPDTELELPSSLFAIEEDSTTHLLHIKGESILDVTRSGLLLQLRNLSGYSVRLQPSDQEAKQKNPHYDLVEYPDYTASLFIIAYSSLPNQMEVPISNKSTINPSDLEAIFEVKGQSIDGHIKFVLAHKPRIGEFDLRLDTGIGINSVAAFTGSDEKASVIGDLVVYEEEKASVLNSLKRGNIDVISAFTHSTKSKNKTIFLHYKGQGNAKKLAQTLKTALSLVNEHKLYCNVQHNHMYSKKPLIFEEDCKNFLRSFHYYNFLNFSLNSLLWNSSN